jgi:uncharacterized surface protein with fasciclin (FAS1) repeats
MTKRLFAILRYTTVVALVAGAFFLSGCSDDDEKPTKTIYELLSEDPSLSKIKAQVDLNADLKAKLQDGSGTYTFFAPNDLAMSAILTTLGLTDFATIAPTTLSTVLNYHLVSSVKMKSDMTSGSKITTAQGEDITIVVTSTGDIQFDTGASTNGSLVTADVVGTNGVLHVVGDYPLVPPTIGNLILATLGKVAQPILLSAAFSILTQAILKADAGKPANQTIVGAMIAQTGQTFFAPSDQVLTAAGLNVATMTAAQLDAFVRGHMVPSTSVATLGDATLPTMLTVGGTNKTVTTTSTTVKGNANANAVTVVVAAKITTSNGVIYPIAGVIQHQ